MGVSTSGNSGNSNQQQKRGGVVTRLFQPVCVFLFLIAFISLAVVTVNASNDTMRSQPEYIAALKIADRAVQRKKALQQNGGSALSSAIIKSFFGRYYQVGDTWDMAMVRIAIPAMRMTSDSDKLKPIERLQSVFRYRVTEVQSGENPEVTIEVTQLDAYGLKPVDPKVEKLTLKMDDRLIQSRKAYSIKGLSEPVLAAGDGPRSRVTALELLPLDAPEIVTAMKQDATKLPELPASLEEIAKKTSYDPDLSRSTWMDQDDFFGRPIEILWQKGDPWPTYMKTVHGVAILVRKETS